MSEWTDIIHLALGGGGGAVLATAAAMARGQGWITGLIDQRIAAHRTSPEAIKARRDEMNATIDDSIHRDDGAINEHVRDTAAASNAAVVEAVRRLDGKMDAFATTLSGVQHDVSNLAGQLQGYDRRRVEVPSPTPGSLGQSPRYTPDPAR